MGPEKDMKQTQNMLLSHCGEYPCEHENLKFVANSPKMIRLARRNTEKVRPYECLRNSYESLRISANPLRIILNYNFETGSMTGILEHFKWESLKNGGDTIVLLYKGLKGKASIPTDDLIPLVRRCRNDHSMAYQVPIANTDIYKCSCSPQTIRDWNALPQEEQEEQERRQQQQLHCFVRIRTVGKVKTNASESQQMFSDHYKCLAIQ